jgi:hypothetical protein
MSWSRSLLSQYFSFNSLCLQNLRQTPVDAVIATHERHSLKNVSFVFDWLAPAGPLAFGTWCSQFSNLAANTITQTTGAIPADSGYRFLNINPPTRVSAGAWRDPLFRHQLGGYFVDRSGNRDVAAFQETYIRLHLAFR